MTYAIDREPLPLPEHDGRSGPLWEHELKYVVSRLSLEAVRCHLDSLCLPDPSYPENTVASVYFDTPDFRSSREKFNGDYLKTKFRIRWYEQSGNFSRAFAEVKHRSGARRRKFRFDTEHEGRELSRRWGGQIAGVGAIQGRGFEIVDRYPTDGRALGPRSPARSTNGPGHGEESEKEQHEVELVECREKGAVARQPAGERLRVRGARRRGLA